MPYSVDTDFRHERLDIEGDGVYMLRSTCINCGEGFDINLYFDNLKTRIEEHRSQCAKGAKTRAQAGD